MEQEGFTEEQQLCLYHLYFILNQIRQGTEALDDFEKLDNVTLQQLNYILLGGMSLSFIIIRICAFFDEYNIYFKPLFQKTHQEAIEEIQRIKSVIYEKWPHLDDFRDEAAAHSFREPLTPGHRNPAKFVSLFKDGIEALYLDPYKIPNNIIDLRNLEKHLKDIQLILYSTFADIFVKFQIGGYPPNRKG